MAKPTPTANERPFVISELFFSTTDLRGIILSGNDVFQRISGYPFTELIGAPHNIIRHPDMPKLVFKVLWDTIQAGNMIAAYVKNMAADGAYYWVLAIVFPIGDKYLSIRLKPSTGLRAAAESIYAAMLAEEKTNGVEASGKVLFAALEKAGFKTYAEFMIAAIVSELKARDEAVKLARKSDELTANSVTDRDLGQILSQLAELSKDTAEGYRLLFGKIGEFDQSRKVFYDQVQELLKTFSKFQLLSLNMRVFAAQIGLAGASLGVVAENFQNLANDIETYLQSFFKLVEALCEDIQKLSLETACLKVQMDMVDFFVEASLRKALANLHSDGKEFLELEQSSEMFLGLSAKYNKGSLDVLARLKDSVEQFLASNKDIRKFVNGLELISQVGAVEAARLQAAEQDFKHYIDSMNEFSDVLRNSTQVIIGSTRNLSENIRYIDRNLSVVGGRMKEVLALATKAGAKSH